MPQCLLRNSCRYGHQPSPGLSGCLSTPSPTTPTVSPLLSTRCG